MIHTPLKETQFDQRLAQAGQRGCQAALHRSGGQFQHFGALRQAQAVEIVQDEDFALRPRCCAISSRMRRFCSRACSASPGSVFSTPPVGSDPLSPRSAGRGRGPRSSRRDRSRRSARRLRASSQCPSRLRGTSPGGCPRWPDGSSRAAAGRRTGPLVAAHEFGERRRLARSQSSQPVCIGRHVELPGPRVPHARRGQHRRR